jgi:Protein of unknown function (DUF1553)/Protein of unknown function (DUF1549)/Planctomycete cytochrome C
VRWADGFRFRSVLAAAFLAALPLLARGEGVEIRPSLESDVLPLFKARCLKCHSPLKAKGKLNLSSPRSLARGGASGAVLVPGNLDESTLWDLVSNDEMPPKPEAPLPADEKALLRRWIEQGAADLPDAAEVHRAAPETDHWAFAPRAHPLPPSPGDHRRVRNAIDRFIQKSLERQGLTLGPDADRPTLIRRVSFDLTGLPPQPEEVAAFVADPDPFAYETLFERLLASPRYGERWGKYWLDASGYADSNGYFSADSDRPFAYRYRDYIIRAFNADRPLDRIVREQLAGDELAGDRRGPDATPATIDLLIATHFLRNGQDGTGESDGNPDEVRADKYAVLEGAIQIIGSSLLGLTLQCAKCHDHKFEPVTQQEYYQLQAILYPAFNVEHWVKPNDRIAIAGPRDELMRWELHEKVIDAQIEALKRTFAAGPDAAKKQKEKALEPVIEALNARRQPNPYRIAWVGDVSSQPSEIPLLIRGDLATPGLTVKSGVPAFLTDPDNRYEPNPPFAGSSSTGRRLALARWLTKPGSRPAALLARVLANRIWQQHFGQGLATTSDNLGYTGAPPSHPELLEFLAAELVRSGWSTKAMHRLILASTVYRQSSLPHPEAARVDPGNRLLARFPLRRLDAEAIRDAMLTVTGELDDRPGGPYVPTQRNESGEVVVDESVAGANRRSVYLQQHRTQIASFLDVFDAPSIVTTCTRRLPSTIPLQSLSLLNSDFVVTRAQKLAKRLERECGLGDNARMIRAFLLTIGRAPVKDELDAARRFLEAQPSHYPGQAETNVRHRAWVDFCQMLLASNAFLYVE